MKPVIGISSTKKSLRPNSEGCYVGDGYFNGIARCGAVPFVLPLVDDDEMIAEMVDRVDGLLLTGGEDIAPHHFGEMPHAQLGDVFPLRDRFELAITRQALAAGKPVLAICRGIQTLNVAVGGTLYQDIASQLPEAGQHMQKAPYAEPTHFVSLKKGSQLRDIFGSERIFTNSFHHQSAKAVPAGWEVVGESDDGVIEAIESVNHRFAIGVQWHPEMMWGRDDAMLGLCRRFVESAAQWYKTVGF